MCDKTDLELCRLCLNCGGLLINIFDEDSKLEYMLENTIEDLIGVKVVEDASYPWLVCFTCMEKLTEFRLFKRRCAECLFVFHNRIKKGCNLASEDWITNLEKIQREIKKEFGNDAIVSDAMDVSDDMITAVEDVHADSGCSIAHEKVKGSSVVPSMQEDGGHLLGKEERVNLGLSEEGRELHFHEELDIKEECDTDIPREEGDDLRGDVSQGTGCGQGRDEAGNLSRTCQLCNKVFAQRDILKVHVMRVHHEKHQRPLTCDVCSMEFDCKRELEGHAMKSNHALKKKHQCQHCCRRFRKLNELRTHMYRHTGDRPYKCVSCLKGFSSKGELKRHLLTHTDERPYGCGMCSKAFKRKAHLDCHVDKTHMLAHGVKEEHRCTVCSKVFTRKGVLNRHALTHSGERRHKCGTCSKSFILNGDLKRHLLTHTGQRPYQCGMCPKSYTRKEHLDYHSVRHNGQS
ncbi:gastrula zinc finger protein XlCGF57.1-like isoform X2 [Hetaerina americana]|uniref:gastrula zinc finger protein XlCGF57.1-like isoform X2 n=1 Tax=Hetaerina americana TaxID=62018 RepID=UPI003A7F5E3C